jgi:hypothetical protein
LFLFINISSVAFLFLRFWNIKYNWRQLQKTVALGRASSHLKCWQRM